MRGEDKPRKNLEGEITMNKNTKDGGMSFNDWFEDYFDLMREAGAGSLVERRDAERLYDKNYTPEKAANGELRFMATGEY